MFWSEAYKAMVDRTIYEQLHALHRKGDYGLRINSAEWEAMLESWRAAERRKISPLTLEARA